MRIIRLLRLMKLLRVLKGMKIFERMESRVELNYASLSLQQFIVFLVILAHWMGCTFNMLHDLQWEGRKCWEIEDANPKNNIDGRSMFCTWLTQYERRHFNGRINLAEAPVMDKYLLCLYWAFGEITGNGDLPGPSNSTERVYLLVINVACVFVNAMIIGGVVNIINQLSARKKEFHNSMDNLNSFLREKNIKHIDRDLCTRLRQFYLFKQYKGADDANVWEEVLRKVSPTLQGDVANTLHNHWMITVPYFQGVDRRTGRKWRISDRFRVQVALSIKSDVYAPFEPIYTEDDLASGLMVVERGLVGCRGRLFRTGGVFGQDVFLNEDGASKRGHNANALSHAMILCVPGDTMHELLRLPENKHILKRVRTRICLETLKDIALRMAKSLRIACDIKLTPFEGTKVLENEFGRGVFSKVPMMRTVFNRRRAEAGDTRVAAYVTLQSAVARHKFRTGINRAVKLGRRIRAQRAARHALVMLVTAAGLDAEDYVDKLLDGDVTAAWLMKMTPAEVSCANISIGHALDLCQAVAAVPAIEKEAILTQASRST